MYIDYFSHVASLLQRASLARGKKMVYIIHSTRVLNNSVLMRHMILVINTAAVCLWGPSAPTSWALRVLTTLPLLPLCYVPPGEEGRKEGQAAHTHRRRLDNNIVAFNCLVYTVVGNAYRRVPYKAQIPPVCNANASDEW